MSKEIPTPSPVEVRNILSTPAEEGTVADELVYTALGMYNDQDYIGISRVVADNRCLPALAQAEARLQIINNYDRRKSGYPGHKHDQHVKFLTLDGINAILRELDDSQRSEFFDIFELELTDLEIEQSVAEKKSSLDE